jgi:predicted dehydrogenase
LVWRLRQQDAGSGALGDIGAHIIDVAQFLTDDQLTDVTGLMTTFVADRPLASASTGLSGQAPGPERAAVTVDDAALVLGRFRQGAVASFEATRFATGRKNALRIEINGERGSLAFDLERLNELELFDSTSPSGTQGFRRILMTEQDHPYLKAWWPPGHIIGWEHTFTHQVRDLLHAIATNDDPSPSFADGLQVQRVLSAVEESARSGRWKTIPSEGPGARTT